MSEFGAEIIQVVIFGAIMLFLVLAEQGKRNPDNAYKQGYEDALNNVSRRLIDACRDGHKKRAMKAIYDNFLKPEYNAQTICCMYHFPWDEKPKKGKVSEAKDEEV